MDVLNLSNNKIVEIKHDTFENLPELNVLDLSLNQITALPGDAFEPLVSLVTLYLQGNQIQFICSDLFCHNKYLIYLNLSNNNLKTFHFDLFRHNEYLYYLNQSNNSLIIIQPKSFRYNLDLHDLYVNDNHNLSRIDLFPENRNKISILELSNCGFIQLHIPKNVETIHAQFNKINSITAHPESALRFLQIDHNNLTDLAHLPVLNNLVQLHMLNNAIELINFINLSPFENLTRSSIDLNPMQNISAANIRTNFPKLDKLYINSPDMSIDQQQRILDDLEEFVRVVILKESATRSSVFSSPAF